MGVFSFVWDESRGRILRRREGGRGGVGVCFLGEYVM